MSYFVYIVRCKDGTYYTGATNNLDKRLKAHNAGKGARYTHSRTPVKLVYQELKRTIGSAYRREYKIKQLTRAEKSLLIKQAQAKKKNRPR